MYLDSTILYANCNKKTIKKKYGKLSPYKMFSNSGDLMPKYGPLSFDNTFKCYMVSVNVT